MGGACSIVAERDSHVRKGLENFCGKRQARHWQPPRKARGPAGNAVPRKPCRATRSERPRRRPTRCSDTLGQVFPVQRWRALSEASGTSPRGCVESPTPRKGELKAARMERRAAGSPGAGRPGALSLRYRGEGGGAVETRGRRWHSGERLRAGADPSFRHDGQAAGAGGGEARAAAGRQLREGAQAAAEGAAPPSR